MSDQSAHTLDKFPVVGVGLSAGGLEAFLEHYAIDAFFESLAEDQGSGALGIILSGGRADGSRPAPRSWISSTYLKLVASTCWGECAARII